MAAQWMELTLTNTQCTKVLVNLNNAICIMPLEGGQAVILFPEQEQYRVQEPYSEIRERLFRDQR